MGKYNFDLNINKENSLSIILRNIRKKSKVLEFGPAYGRMTRYLKEKLECDVYIVEIDKEAAKVASKYADKCYIGDIEEYEWYVEFQDEKFDYIVFADVLEHLYYPEEVLKKCRNLLKETGSIFISIPNIAHNSVIIDLINNKFNYKETGILDNTHIRFFTYYSSMEMFNKLNYDVVKVLATYNSPNDTEFKNNYAEIESELNYYLKNKEFGEVYQFIFELKLPYKSNEKVFNIKKFPMQHFLQIFIDCGNGFYEENCIIKYINNNCVNSRFQFDLSKYKNLKSIRIDPLNIQCLVKIDEILIDGKKFKIEYSNAEYTFDNYYIFDNTDPQLHINLRNDGGNRYNSLSFTMSLYFLNKSYKDLFINIVSKYNEKIKNINNEILLRNQISEKEKIIEKLNKKIQNIEKQLKIKNDKLIEKEYEINNREKIIESLNKKIDNIKKEVKIKENRLIENENTISLYKARELDLFNRVNHLEKILREMNMKINMLKININNINVKHNIEKEEIRRLYEESRSWEYTSIFRKIINKIRR